MAAVTSHQSKFHQLEIRIRGKFGPYTGLGFRSVIFSLASPWIKINCKGTVMLWFDCRPTLILLKTSSTSRAVFWLLVESRIYKENKNNTVNWVAIASQIPLRAIGQTSILYTATMKSARLHILFSHNRTLLRNSSCKTHEAENLGVWIVDPDCFHCTL